MAFFFFQSKIRKEGDNRYRLYHAVPVKSFPELSISIGENEDLKVSTLSKKKHTNRPPLELIELGKKWPQSWIEAHPELEEDPEKQVSVY